MTATEILLQLAGAVALLLWGLRMVQTGIQRRFGPALRQAVQNNTSNRVRAFSAGMGITVLLQSSTAAALITASFSRLGYLTLPAALAVVLGADVGTAAVAQVLAFDLGALPYVLVFCGYLAHRLASSAGVRQLGRVAIGLGLMLLALSLIVAAGEPMQKSAVLQALLSSLAGEPLVAVLVAAFLAWAAHSSLATVLFVTGLAGSGMLSLPLIVTLILGANLGGTIPAIVATLGSGADARRVTAGNAIMKSAGVLICLPAVGSIAAFLGDSGFETGRLVVLVHLSFNLALAVVFLPLTNVVASLAARLIPVTGDDGSEQAARFLDRDAIETPTVALSCASREVLSVAEVVETMLRGAIASDSGDGSSALKAMNDQVAERCEEIKLYVTDVSNQETSKTETLRGAEILMFTTNLAHIADIVVNILETLSRKSRENLKFSPEGAKELAAYHNHVATNFNLALSLFMSSDVPVARQLLEEKTRLSKLQSAYTENHLKRLRTGKAESIATSALHLDVLRDLRRIHSHITAVGYPVLERAGALRKSRLRK